MASVPVTLVFFALSRHYFTNVDHITDKEREIDLPTVKIEDLSGADIKTDEQTIAKVMSTISGVHKLQSTNNNNNFQEEVPKFGIPVDDEIKLCEVDFINSFCINK